VPTFNEVRDKIESRYAKAKGMAELQGTSVESHMMEIEGRGPQHRGAGPARSDSAELGMQPAWRPARSTPQPACVIRIHVARRMSRVMASTVPDGTDSGDYETIDALLASMDRSNADLHAADDPRASSTARISRTTVRCATRFSAAASPTTVGRTWDVVFAGLYLRAFEQYEATALPWARGRSPSRRPATLAAAAAPRAARDERAHQLRPCPSACAR
jgi:hypothetical protein